ncbi:MAG TPA: ABC transporter substrate-binding protein [Polyangiaceae bacterium]|nr:ABC transporter substrate-binding protein [Polyangiaceae bacterium]
MAGEGLSRRGFAFGAAALGAAGCGPPPRGDTGPGGELRVGAYLSLSGEEAQFGIDTREGIDLATGEANAAGGVRGRRLVVVYADDKTDPYETAQKVRMLIDREGVLALLGEVASGRSRVGGLVANQRKVPMITPSSTDARVTRGRPYVFRACFTSEAQASAAAAFVARSLGRRKAALLYAAQDPYSSGLAAAFRKAALALSLPLVAEKGFQKGEKNFRTYLNQLAAAGPDVVYAPLYYTDMVPVARQARAAGLPGSLFFGCDAWDAEDLLRDAGAELEGALFTNHYALDVPWESSTRFVAAYRRRFGREPSGIAAQGYDAARLLYDAIVRAEPLDREGLRGAIAATRGFGGATGAISIDDERNAQKAVLVVAVRGGRFRFHAAAPGA